MKYLVTAKAQRPGVGQAMTVAVAQAADDPTVSSAVKKRLAALTVEERMLELGLEPTKMLPPLKIAG